LSAVKVIAQIQWNGATKEIGAGRRLAEEINGRWHGTLSVVVLIFGNVNKIVT